VYSGSRYKVKILIPTTANKEHISDKAFEVSQQGN